MNFQPRKFAVFIETPQGNLCLQTGEEPCPPARKRLVVSGWQSRTPCNKPPTSVGGI